MLVVLTINIIVDPLDVSPFLASIILMVIIYLTEFVRAKNPENVSFMNTRLYRYSIYFCYFVVIALMAFSHEFLILLILFIAYEGVKWSVRAIKNKRKK
ncbi:putative membrane protein [Jeotgalibacillus terrae]|nr:putative membrane protein [Jeotgalibacillus terrae]